MPIEIFILKSKISKFIFLCSDDSVKYMLARLKRHGEGEEYFFLKTSFRVYLYFEYLSSLVFYYEIFQSYIKVQRAT